MYFNRMKSFYEQQSSGKYSISGAVTEWVKVPFNQARYGNDACGDVVCNSVWFLVRDALAQWTQDKLDAGWSMAKIQNYLKTFDKQDRYDFDEDGDFNEPDGYIDHFQIVHAGGDEADGDPIYGADAIWSHRWNAQVEPYGTGPEGGAPIGGVNVGEGGPSDGGAVQIPDNPTGSGSTTTRSSRRTAACRSSRTSSATTSACPTSTTPRAGTTRRALGPDGPVPGHAAPRRRHRRPAPSRSARGTSSSSGGSTTTSLGPAAPGPTRSDPAHRPRAATPTR